jgi:hypothetical protein
MMRQISSVSIQMGGNCQCLWLQEKCLEIKHDVEQLFQSDSNILGQWNKN